MRKAFIVSAVLAVAVLAFCGIMFRFAEARPVQRNVTVALRGLPSGTPPLKVALLADLHVAKYGDSPERLRETVARVTALRPDLVLIAGDFLADPILKPVPMRPNVAPLAGLKAPLGVFAVFGNHDYRDNTDRLTFWLSRVGVRVLDNEAFRAGPLAVVGISDAFSGHARLGPALRSANRVGEVPIVFTHSPDIVPDLPANVELAMAGHTHCGQVVLPLIGPLDTRSRYGARYACGVILEGARTTVVTAGLGVSRAPFRLGAPPDFWLITLVPRTTR